jgi:hypothetical protein
LEEQELRWAVGSVRLGSELKAELGSVDIGTVAEASHDGDIVEYEKTAQMAIQRAI